MRLVPLFVALIGCGTSVHALMINRPPHPMPSRPPEEVQLFTSGPPARPYLDIAYLEAEQESGFSSDETPQFFTRLRETAGRMGCDGVVIGHKSARGVATPFSRNNEILNGLTATCIVYVDDSELAAKR